MQLTRRSFSAAALGGLVASSVPALAKAPLAGRQAPAVYRQNVGAFEVTVLKDGWLPIDAKNFTGDAEGAARLLAAAFQSTPTPTSVNEWLVNTGDKLVLVDTGTSNVFAPTLGRLPASLAAAGVSADAVDAVILTHMHPDHAAGLLTPSKAVAFPNASIHVNAAEYAFWTSAEMAAAAPESSRGFFAIAQAAIKRYADAGRVTTFKDGTEILPGFTAVEALGHTPGHTMIRLSSDGRDLLLWGDIVHNFALQFAEPQRSIAFDTDGATALASRLRVLDMASADKLMIAGSHLPFPGLGHVAKAGSGYAYVPASWTADL